MTSTDSPITSATEALEAAIHEAAIIRIEAWPLVRNQLLDSLHELHARVQKPPALDVEELIESTRTAAAEAYYWHADIASAIAAAIRAWAARQATPPILDAEGLDHIAEAADTLREYGTDHALQVADELSAWAARQVGGGVVVPKHCPECGELRHEPGSLSAACTATVADLVASGDIPTLTHPRGLQQSQAPAMPNGGPEDPPVPEPGVGAGVLADVAKAAFLAGAKWWEFESQKATMWQSDQWRVWEEAERRYPTDDAVRERMVPIEERVARRQASGVGVPTVEPEPADAVLCANCGHRQAGHSPKPPHYCMAGCSCKEFVEPAALLPLEGLEGAVSDALLASPLNISAAYGVALIQTVVDAVAAWNCRAPHPDRAQLAVEMEKRLELLREQARRCLAVLATEGS